MRRLSKIISRDSIPEGAIICDEMNLMMPGAGIPLKRLQGCGNVRAFGSVAAGAALALYGIKNVGIDKIFHELFSEKQHSRISMLSWQETGLLPKGSSEKEGFEKRKSAPEY